MSLRVESAKVIIGTDNSSKWDCKTNTKVIGSA